MGMAEALEPFAGGAVPASLLRPLQLYLDLLQRWNARINLTALRQPDEMVARHFGESLFAARMLLRSAASDAASSESLAMASEGTFSTLADVGSGAGFPGIPIKLLAPQAGLTLIESNHKKATFLREVVRTLKLQQTEVFCGRAEQWGKTAEVVTLRAVERFAEVLPVAASLVAEGGRLCLLIGTQQVTPAKQLLGGGWRWHEPELVPNSNSRAVIVASRRP